MDNELKTTRRELKLREDQLRALERETQVSKTSISYGLLTPNFYAICYTAKIQSGPEKKNWFALSIPLASV